LLASTVQSLLVQVLYSTTMPTTRVKRAVATRGHSKTSKRVLKDLSNQSERTRNRSHCSVVKETTIRSGSTPPWSSVGRYGSESSFVFDFDSAACVLPGKRRASLTKRKTRSRKSESSRRRRGQVGPSQRGSNKKSSGDAALFSGSSLSSSSEWINRKQVELEMSTDEKDRMEHQRRRSLRLINSVGPMLLSYRTSYRIETSKSPVYSPIASCRLRFTPVAHLPTTPVAS